MMNIQSLQRYESPPALYQEGGVGWHRLAYLEGDVHGGGQGHVGHLGQLGCGVIQRRLYLQEGVSKGKSADSYSPQLSPYCLNYLPASWQARAG